MINKKDAIIKIKSTHYDVYSAENINSNIENECGETIEIITEGILTQEDNQIQLSYNESEITGLEGSITTLYFNSEDKDIVSMIRTGSVSTVLIFESKKRHICVYNTPFMPFEICINTRKLSSNINFDGGFLDIDYDVEIKGTKSERNIFHLEFEEVV